MTSAQKPTVFSIDAEAEGKEIPTLTKLLYKRNAVASAVSNLEPTLTLNKSPDMAVEQGTSVAGTPPKVIPLSDPLSFSGTLKASVINQAGDLDNRPPRIKSVWEWITKRNAKGLLFERNAKEFRELTLNFQFYTASTSARYHGVRFLDSNLKTLMSRLDLIGFFETPPENSPKRALEGWESGARAALGVLPNELLTWVRVGPKGKSAMLAVISSGSLRELASAAKELEAA